MENKETICTLKGIEQKTGKQGTVYFSVDTDCGKMTVFDIPLIEEVRSNIGKKVQLDVAVNEKGFKNIRKITVIPIEKIGTVAQAQSQPEDQFADARKLKDTSIYTSYVKDLIVSGMKPDEAIVLVKKIRTEFS